MSWQAMKAQILLSFSWIGLEKQICQVIRLWICGKEIWLKNYWKTSNKVIVYQVWVAKSNNLIMLVNVEYGKSVLYTQESFRLSNPILSISM